MATELIMQSAFAYLTPCMVTLLPVPHFHLTPSRLADSVGEVQRLKFWLQETEAV